MSLITNLLVLLAVAVEAAPCPYLAETPSRNLFSQTNHGLPGGHPPVPSKFRQDSMAAYTEAVSNVDWAAAKADIIDLLDSAQPIWPPDDLGFKFPKKSYIGLFVRLVDRIDGPDLI